MSKEECILTWKNHFTETKRPLRKGDILRVKYKGKTKLIRNLSTFKMNKKKSNGFRNALTVEIFMRMKGKSPKCVNMKISCNGKLQITGPQCTEDAVICVQSVWRVLQTIKGPNIYKLDGDFTGIFETVMTNIDFNIGFKINRSELDHYMNHKTDHRSLFEHNFGYTGVNIKFQLKKTLDHALLKMTKVGNDWIASYVTYNDYISKLPLKKRQKLNKPKYNTFLVFHSGQVIMSGKTKYYMKEPYHAFLDIVQKHRPLFEERLKAAV